MVSETSFLSFDDQAAATLTGALDSLGPCLNYVQPLGTKQHPIHVWRCQRASHAFKRAISLSGYVARLSTNDQVTTNDMTMVATLVTP